MKNKIDIKTVMWTLGALFTIGGAYVTARIAVAEDIAVLKEQNKHAVKPESVATISADYRALLQVNKTILSHIEKDEMWKREFSKVQNRMIGALNAQGIKVSVMLKNDGVW